MTHRSWTELGALTYWDFELSPMRKKWMCSLWEEVCAEIIVLPVADFDRPSNTRFLLPSSNSTPQVSIDCLIETIVVSLSCHGEVIWWNSSHLSRSDICTTFGSCCLPSTNISPFLLFLTVNVVLLIQFWSYWWQQQPKEWQIEPDCWKPHQPELP